MLMTEIYVRVLLASGNLTINMTILHFKTIHHAAKNLLTEFNRVQMYP